jgi:hypothetical protein
MVVKFDECIYWARSDSRLITVHHPDCPNYNLEEEVADILRALVKGIEEWAADEDGVHYLCWDAYQNALLMLGRYKAEIDQPYDITEY